jgi:hypothetical protein
MHNIIQPTIGFAPRAALLGAAFALLAFDATSARAIEVNLLSGGSTLINGAYYTTDSQLPAASTLDPFVRLSQNGAESGYNASVRPLMPSVNPSNSLTHDIQLAQITTVTDPGAGTSGNYYEFLLKLNDSGSAQNITLHTLQIYTNAAPLSSAATLADLTGSGATLNYDLDLGSDSRIHLNSGVTSGPGNLFVYVPVSAFGNIPGSTYLYLYSGFGSESGGTGTYYVANGGFETWGVRDPLSTADAAGVPENSTTITLLGAAFVALACFRRYGARATRV